MYCYLLVSLCLFESFRWDLNEAKAVSCNVVNYLISSVNISQLPLCNYDAPITSPVSSNVANYYLSSGERRIKETRDETKMRPVSFCCLNLLIQNKIVQNLASRLMKQ